MRHIVTVAAAALVAFGAGFGAAHLTAPAAAAAVPMTPQVVDLGALTSNDLPPAAPGAAVRAKALVAQDGAMVGIQIGTVPKHYHADANEIQYVARRDGRDQRTPQDHRDQDAAAGAERHAPAALSAAP
jgi:hypothetical protein